MALPAGTFLWKKWLIQVGEEIAGAVSAYLLSQLVATDSSHTSADMVWARCIVSYLRTTPAGTYEDLAQFSIDAVNITGGVVDASWTTTDYNNFGGPVSALITALRPYQAPNVSIYAAKYYEMRFNPAGWPGRRFQDTGPPVAGGVYTAVAGSGSGTLPYQSAMSITERTAWEGHWGRAYLPGPAAGTLDSYGRFTSTARAGVANAFKACYEAMVAADIHPVVPVTQVNKVPAFGLLTVNQIVVDDVPDVIRSRRPKQVAARTVVP